MTPTEVLDAAARRGLLYVVVVTPQHESHRSVTLTILHGRNPQGKRPKGEVRLVVAAIMAAGNYIGANPVTPTKRVVFECHTPEVLVIVFLFGGLCLWVFGFVQSTQKSSANMQLLMVCMMPERSSALIKCSVLRQVCGNIPCCFGKAHVYYSKSSPCDVCV